MLKRDDDLKATVPVGPPPFAMSLMASPVTPSAPTPVNLEKLMAGYSTLRIDDPVRVFNESNLEEVVKKVDYGALKALDGTWVSYNENFNNPLGKKSLGSGIHTTIMPSPGTNSGTIPGKFVFDCEEYLEKLTFTLVPGGVRNRGGASELFCGAIKYEQTIKSVGENADKSGQPKSLQYVPIHEENGMYLWLSDVYNFAATEETIARDRGIHEFSDDDKKKGINVPYRDEPLVQVTDSSGKKSYILYSQLKPGQKYDRIVAAQELKQGAGVTGPYFIPDYSISRSGVIPHGSTVTLLGNVQSSKGKFLFEGSPQDTHPPTFPSGLDAWPAKLDDFDGLSISPTMGGGGIPRIDLDKAPPPWVFQQLTDQNDPGSNLIYTQRILAHPLYPYCARPDMRLRDAISKQKIKNYVLIKMGSRNTTGAQGGILNVPFVTRFVPTVEVKFTLWIETVVENGKEILQLQYVQIIRFEFHFGNDGTTTSWPHIQVNTLRKLEDIPEDQRKVIEKQFFNDLTTEEKDKLELNKSEAAVGKEGEKEKEKVGGGEKGEQAPKGQGAGAGRGKKGKKSDQ